MRSWQLILVILILSIAGPVSAQGPFGDAAADRAAREELSRLERMAADPRADADELWQKLVRLRRLHPCTAAASRATELMARVRSPLDRLDASHIPLTERFNWQPQGLVAILGEHRGRHWGDTGGATISPDGKFVVSVGTDGLRMWNIVTMQEKLWLKGVRTFAYAPDGKTLAVGEHADVIRLYQAEGSRLKPLSLLRKKGHTFHWLGFAPRGRILLARSWGVPKSSVRGVTEELLVVWHWGNDGVKEKEVELVRGAGWIGACSGDGRYYAYQAFHKLYLHALPGGKLYATLKNKGGTFAFAPKGKLLITAGGQRGLNDLTLWQLAGAKPKSLGVVASPLWVPEQLLVSPDGRWLVGLNRDRLRWWAVSELQGELSVNGRGWLVPKEVKLPLRPSTMCFAPDSRILLLTGRDGSVHLWDLEQQKTRFSPRSAGGWPTFSPEGRTLVVSGTDRMLRLWNLGGRQPQQVACWELPENAGPAYTISFSPGGDLLASSPFAGREIWLWKRAENQLRLHSRIPLDQDNFVRSLAFSPRGGSLVAAGFKQVEDDEKGVLEQGMLWRWRLPSGGQKAQPDGSFPVGKPSENSREASAQSLVFSPNGRRLAAVKRSSIHLWDWQPSPREASVVKGRYVFGGAKFSPDGAQMVAAGLEYHDPRPGESYSLGGLFFWGLTNGRLQSQKGLLERACTTTKVEFALGGKALLTDGPNDENVLYDRATLRKLWRWRGPGMHCSGFALAPDGRHVALSNANGTIYIVRLKEATKPGGK